MQVRFDASKTLSMFHRLPKNLQDEVGKGMYDMALNNQNSLKKQLRMVSKSFKGNHKIKPGIKARKISNNTSIVNMPLEGIYLDSMKTHWVSLKRGRMITRWAIERGLEGVDGRLPRAIQVHAHPFIYDGMLNAKKKNKSILNNIAKKAIDKSRR